MIAGLIAIPQLATWQLRLMEIDVIKNKQIDEHSEKGNALM